MSKRKYKKKTIVIFLLLILLLFVGVFMVISMKNVYKTDHDGDAIYENTQVTDSFKDEVDDEVVPESVEEQPTVTEEERIEAEIDKTIERMTLEQKIYQMFIITPEQLTGISNVTAAGDTTREKLEQYPVGGIIYFSSNLSTPDQTKKMLSSIQCFSEEIEGLPLFLCVDEEGGSVSRIAKNPDFSVDVIGPMAEVSSAEEAYKCGNVIGAYLNELGFNVDFAPDADVLTNSNNIVIGDRSFGTDPNIVTEYATKYSDGLHANGILSTFKHFPGHGATEADTHEGYAYSNKTYNELMESELKPFTIAQEEGIDMVMVAHISLPNVIGDDTPCSLSYKMITEILREEFYYDGIVITDALNMGAISEGYSSSEAAIKAVNAGVDLLLAPVDFNSAYAGIYEAVQNGEISEERIDDSVRRIVRAKYRIKGDD